MYYFDFMMIAANEEAFGFFNSSEMNVKTTTTASITSRYDEEGIICIHFFKFRAHV